MGSTALSRIAVAALAAAACGDDGGAPIDAAPIDAPIDAILDGDPRTEIAPGPPFVVSVGPAGAQDEDPSLARTAAGSLLVAWYSNRNGLAPSGHQDKEIFVSRTDDARTWAAPVQATRGDAWAFYPDLAIEPDGAVHLAWWTVTLLPPGCAPGACAGTDNRIAYARSPDGLQWDLDGAVEIAAGPGDWLPVVVPDPAGPVRIYFAAVARNPDGSRNLAERRNHVYVVVGSGTSWSTPTRVTGIDDGTSHHTYPDVVRTAGGEYLMTWTRYDGALGGDPLAVLQTNTSEIMTARSTDGVAFTAPTVISDAGPGAEADVFPHLFTDHAGAWHVTWRSTATAPGGAQLELPFGGSYPADRVVRPELDGYTAQEVATATPDLAFGVFVTGADPSQEILGRFFAR